MKREDFKEILPVHIESCKRLIEFAGDCTSARIFNSPLFLDLCSRCPFNFYNSTNNKNCLDNDYSREIEKFKNDKKLIENCKKFINLFEKDFESKKTLGEEIKKDVEKTVQAICEATPGRIKTVEDNVNQPNHYKLDGLDVEVLDVIKAVLTKEQFEGFLHGNVIKYTLRTNKKNGVEDLEKAHKYLGWLIDSKNGLKLNK